MTPCGRLFGRETEMFLESIMREDRNVPELLNSDYTFVDERLARHYGIPNVYGSQFRRVKLDGELEAAPWTSGQGQYRSGDIASRPDIPVQRGKWVLMNILGIIPPDPPPNVPPLKERKSRRGQRPDSNIHAPAHG